MGNAWEALVLDIQKMSTEDGPGIRTTVFMKGCNLKCAWCHNPESLSGRQEVVWIGARCIGCGSCQKACPAGAILAKADEIHIDREACRHCMACAEACPTGALEQKGTLYTVDRLAHELMKDRAYFDASFGGVTVSGGEPLLQAEFVRELFIKLKAGGIHTALDTAACVPFPVLGSLLDFTDLLLLDLKLIDDGLHRRFTGQSNASVLENARLASERMADRGGKIWVRTPVIPGATDSAENIAAIGKFISLEMGNAIERWELCAFNNLCRDKYERLGRAWDYRDTPLIERADMERLLELARNSISAPGLAVWTGAVRQGG